MYPVVPSSATKTACIPRSRIPIAKLNISAWHCSTNAHPRHPRSMATVALHECSSMSDRNRNTPRINHCCAPTNYAPSVHSPAVEKRDCSNTLDAFNYDAIKTHTRGRVIRPCRESVPPPESNQNRSIKSVLSRTDSASLHQIFFSAEACRGYAVLSMHKIVSASACEKLDHLIYIQDLHVKPPSQLSSVFFLIVYAVPAASQHCHGIRLFLGYLVILGHSATIWILSPHNSRHTVTQLHLHAWRVAYQGAVGSTLPRWCLRPGGFCGFDLWQWQHFGQLTDKCSEYVQLRLSAARQYDNIPEILSPLTWVSWARDGRSDEALARLPLRKFAEPPSPGQYVPEVWSICSNWPGRDYYLPPGSPPSYKRTRELLYQGCVVRPSSAGCCGQYYTK